MHIFYDVDTQNDFVNADGALAVPGADKLKKNLKALTEYALNTNTQILGSVDKHFGTPQLAKQEAELLSNGGIFPDHCMVATTGQNKIAETNASPFYIPTDSKICNAEGFMNDILKSSICAQTIFEKQCYDVFAEVGGNPNLPKLLKYADVTEAIVYGVATDYCVKAAVLGMLKMGIHVMVVKDAIEAVNVNPDDGKNAIQEMANAGAGFVNTDSIISGII